MDPAPQALQLVAELDGRYEIGESAAAFLVGINEPLSVIVIGGRYRTGKSFLLNRCVLRQHGRSGFNTGSTVNACTKGIWLYPQIVRLPCGGCAVVLDTEGTQSLEASPDQGAKLLSVALVLASLFVFNSVGSIDEVALSDLGVVATVASALRCDDLWEPPELLWALRDFTLRLEDPQGREEPPDAYLERALAPVDGVKNGVRAALRGFFEKRSLFPFVRPVTEESKLQKLNSLPDKELRPEFQEQMRQFGVALQEKLRAPKSVGGQALNGPALLRLCGDAVAAVNSGSAPRVLDAYGFIMEEQLRAAVEAARAELKAQALALMSRLPLPPEELRLAAPETPKSLAAVSVTMRDRLRQARAEVAETELAALRSRDDEARTRWLKEQLELARQGDATAFLDAYMQAAPLRLGAVVALQSLRLLLGAALETSERRAEEAAAGLVRARAAAEERLAEATRFAEAERAEATRFAEVERAANEELKTKQAETKRRVEAKTATLRALQGAQAADLEAAREAAASSEAATVDLRRRLDVQKSEVAALRNEADELREQLEAQLLAPPPQEPERDDAEEMELREALRAVVENRDAVVLQARRLRESLDDAEARTLQVAQELSEAQTRLIETSSTLSAAESLVARREREAREGQEACLAEGVRRLEEVKAEMLRTVQESGEKHREHWQQERAAAERAIQDLEKAERTEARAAAAKEAAVLRAEAAERACSELRTEHVQDLQQLRRSGTEALAERARLMRESYEQTLHECRLARERASVAERTKLRLEIDNESMKRSLEASSEDGLQMQKSRRLHDELREQLGQKEAQLRSQTTLADDLRHRQARQEDRFSEREAALEQLLREKDYRIALLEVELKAK